MKRNINFKRIKFQCKKNKKIEPTRTPKNGKYN